jgi:hypothetical protein
LSDTIDRRPPVKFVRISSSASTEMGNGGARESKDTSEHVDSGGSESKITSGIVSSYKDFLILFGESLEGEMGNVGVNCVDRSRP